MKKRYARQFVVTRDHSRSPWVENLIQVQCGVVKSRRFFQRYSWMLHGLYENTPTDHNTALIERGKTWTKKEALREIESLLETSCSPLR